MIAGWQDGERHASAAPGSRSDACRFRWRSGGRPVQIGIVHVTLRARDAEGVDVERGERCCLLQPAHAQAEAAAEAVCVTWEAEAAVVVDPSLATNLNSRQSHAPPGLDAAFARAPRIVTARFVQHRQTHAPMEPRGCIAIWDPGREHLTSGPEHRPPTAPRWRRGWT
jgi:Molybdopterin-binding domain of aldehyde dehydrogenase